MVKLYAAFTKELDNPEAAVREITEQLKPSETVLKNAVGIVQFYYEYTETGVYEALVEALPFDLVGCATTSIGASGRYGDLAMSVTLITSDDVNFTVRTFHDMDKKSREIITEETTLLFAELSKSEKPKMVLSFMSMYQHFSGDDLIAAADALPETLPLFGTLAFSDEGRQEANVVVSGGEISSNIMAFIAFYGNFEPKFRIHTAFDYDEAFGEDAEITDADGAVLKTVNGMSSVDFLIKQGVITDRSVITGDTNVVGSIPAILTRQDGSKVARAFLGLVDGEPDYVYSAGHIDVGSKISFSCMDSEKTLLGAEKLMTDISASNERNFIAFSCAARAWSFGSLYLDEVKKMAQSYEKYRKTNMPIEYCISYSAGEICPIVNMNGKLVNALHNYSLISCSFD